jgi:hypothetical protein
MRQIRTALLTAACAAALVTAMPSVLSSRWLASAAPEQQLDRVTANLPFAMRKVELPSIPTIRSFERPGRALPL